MDDRITFTLDGREVSARPGESIWEVAKRPAPASRTSATPTRRATAPTATAAPAWSRSRASGCWPPPASARRHRGWWSRTGERAGGDGAGDGDRAPARRPAGARGGARPLEPALADGRPAGRRRRAASRRARPRQVPLLDDSHVAMRVNLDACIHCNLCVRACREVQVNDVIGMAGRGLGERIVFDMADPMGGSTCVACGECVQACPTGALMEASVLDAEERGDSADFDARGALGLPLLRRRLPDRLQDPRRPDRLGRRRRRAGEPEPALRQGTVRLRLHRAPAPADRAADPPRRRAGEGAERRSGEPVDAFPRGVAGTRRSTRRRRGSRGSASGTAARRSPASAAPSARTRRPTSSRS